MSTSMLQDFSMLSLKLKEI